MAMDKAAKQPLSVKIVTRMVLGSIFLYALVPSLMNVIINEVVDGFALSGANQGMMNSMFNVGTTLALLLAPFIQGRIRKVVALLLATALQAASLALCGLSPMFFLFCFGCVMLGAGGGLADAYCNSMLADVHREDSSRYFGYLHGLFGVGSLLAPLLFARVIGWTDWRGAFLLLGGIMFAGVALLWLLARRVHLTAIEQATQESMLSRQYLQEYIRNPRNIMVLVLGALATATQTGILVWIVRYMTLRFDAEALGTASISLFWICATINRFSISRLKIAPIRALILGAGLAALCLGFGVLSNSAWGMFLAMGGLGFTTGHFMQVLFSEANKGHEGRTTFVTSVMIVVMGVSRSVLPLIIAWTSTSVSVVVSMLIPAATSVGVLIFGLLLTRLDARIYAKA